MSKLVLILLVALIFEAVGVVLLSRGLKAMGADHAMPPRQIPYLIKHAATSPYILLGVFFEAIFFLALLALMSRADVSLIWPLTSLGFVITTLAARLILHEHVSTMRWAGVILIVAGAALVSWSEQPKPDAQLHERVGPTASR